MTFTQEDKRDKIRSQLQFEIAHPTIFYEISKKRRDKLDIGLEFSKGFPKKGSSLFYSSIFLYKTY